MQAFNFSLSISLNFDFLNFDEQDRFSQKLSVFFFYDLFYAIVQRNLINRLRCAFTWNSHGF